MATRANVTILNADAVLKSLKKRFESGLQPALEKTKEVVEAKFDTNPPGWMPLKAATIYQRQRLHFGAGPTLYRTGHLKGVAVQTVQVDGPTSGHISTGDPMAVLQNNGGGNIPARPFYKLSKADRAAIVKAFFEGIKGK